MNWRFISDELEGITTAFSNRNGFIRNSFTLTLGTAISQGIPIILSPVLTRLFAPEEFGLLAIVSSITVIISVISTGKYETVIVIARDKRDAVNLVSLSLFLSILISIITLVLFLFFSPVLIGLLNQPRLKYWIFLCPVISFFISVYLCYNEWCIRGSRFANLAVNKVVNAGSITFSNVIYGFIRLTSGGLVIGEITGRFISALACFIQVARREFNEFKVTSRARMTFLAKKYIDCPKYILPGQFLNTFGSQAIVLLIASFFGDTQVGYYSMTSLVLYVPSTIISTAVRDVFKQRATQEFKEKNNCLEIFKRITTAISVFSVLIFGGLYFVLPALFSFAFGENWRIAGEYARILTPMVLISFISESVIAVFIVAEKMKALLIWQITYFVVNVLSLAAGYYIFRDIKIALLCFMVCKSLVHLLSLYMSYNYSKGK